MPRTVSPCPTTLPRRWSSVFLHDPISKEVHVLEKKTFPGLNTSKRLFKWFASQKGRERTYNSKFSKPLRKERSGVRGRKKSVSSWVKGKGTLSPSWSWANQQKNWPMGEGGREKQEGKEIVTAEKFLRLIFAERLIKILDPKTRTEKSDFKSHHLSKMKVTETNLLYCRNFPE